LLDSDWNRLLILSGQPARPRSFFDSFSARFAAVVMIRIAERLTVRGWRRCARVVSFFNFFVFGIEVASALEIGPGLVLPHTHGTVIGAASIGENVTIYQQVTIGAKQADFQFDPATRPRIADGVVIAAGAKVLGPVSVGTRAVIGANAVVISDVPADSLAVGVPARIISGAASAEGNLAI
jgi:serine O-acetyltransferase